MPFCFAEELNLVKDANGNLISGDGFYREYNSLNQLSKVYNESMDLLEEFIYDPVEERVLIKKNYVDNETTYYFSKDFVQVVNSSGVFNFTYVYHNGQLIAQVNPDGSKHFIHTDHLGSSSVVTDENGSIVENTTYSPFGEVLSGGSSRYGYEGKEHDDLVDDTDFHFRKYKPEWGMFTQPDSLIQNVYDPQSLNRYAFERNNPYKYVDEDGHDFGASLMVMGIFLAVGFALSVQNGKVEEAELMGNQELVKKEKIRFYLTAVTGPLSILLPGSGTIKAFDLFSGGGTLVNAYELLSPKHSYTRRVEIRNNLIEQAVQNNEMSSNSGHGGINNYQSYENDPLGVGSFIERWLGKNPNKEEDLLNLISPNSGDYCESSTSDPFEERRNSGESSNSGSSGSWGGYYD